VNFSTIKRIAELHGGSVAIEDNPGGGTIFIIHLPIDAPEETPIEEAVIIED
jgi:signal transduction histidine kinase